MVWKRLSPLLGQNHNYRLTDHLGGIVHPSGAEDYWNAHHVGLIANVHPDVAASYVILDVSKNNISSEICRLPDEFAGIRRRGK